MKRYFIGIDVGTSGAKSVLLDIDGTVIASATADRRAAYMRGYRIYEGLYPALKDSFRELAQIERE